MAKSSTGSSSEASAPMGRSSVYDFLYHDARRVGSFLAQLDSDGLLQGYKRSGRHDRGSAKKDSISPQLGVKTVLGIGGTAENSSSDMMSDASESSYDPLWSNARALLDHLSQRNMLSSELAASGIGQIVQLEGVLKVYNLKMLEALWSSEASRTMILAGAGKNGAAGLEIAASMPHLIQGHFYQMSAEAQVCGLAWMELEENNMVVSPATLAMKYGVWLGGD